MMAVRGLLLLTSSIQHLWLNEPEAHVVGASWQLRLGQVAAAEMPQVLTSMPQEARAARTSWDCSQHLLVEAWLASLLLIRTASKETVAYLNRHIFAGNVLQHT